MPDCSFKQGTNNPLFMEAIGFNRKGKPMHKLSEFKAHYVNKPEQKGELADAKCLFGGYSRYAVAPVYTRFDAVEWFVWDAEKIMTGNYHEPIRQAPTLEEAIKDL